MNPQIAFLLNKSLESIRNFNFELADLYLRQALRMQARNPHTLRLLGVISAQRGQYEDALDYLNNSLQEFPKNALALSNLGNVYFALKEYDNAPKAYDKSIKVDPKYEEAWTNKGNTLYELRQYDAAVSHHERAISLKPDFIEAWTNKGNALSKLRFYEDAIFHHEKAISLNPYHHQAWTNKGVVLYLLGLYDQAINHFDRAISLNPDSQEAWMHKSLIDLFLKRFQAGWGNYDWRLKAKDFQLRLDVKDSAFWDGSNCCHLLIFSDQGLGDIIFYSSILKIVQNRVKSITVSIDFRLLPILARSFPGMNFIDNSLPIDASLYDAHIPFGSLPVVMNMTPDMIGRKVPFIEDNHTLTKIFINQLRSKKRLKCGVAWKSINPRIGDDKSISLTDLKEIFDVEGYDFINLQYGDTREEIKELKDKCAVKLTNINGIDLFENIDGLLSIIQACDFVVTTSNVTAHLAGALGKNTFLLIPYSVGRIWYWHEEKVSSWYPSISLYSQDKNLEWYTATSEIASCLKNEIFKYN